MVFTIKHNMEMTKREKLLKKNIIKIQSFSKTYFQKDGFYQQTQHGNDKKKKFIEKNRKKFWEIFSDMTSSKKGCGSEVS